MDREDIIKLARKAGFDPHDMSDDFTCNLIDIERFAELIVRECADVAKETRWAVPPSQEQIARGIQQHFGVEE